MKIRIDKEREIERREEEEKRISCRTKEEEKSEIARRSCWKIAIHCLMCSVSEMIGFLNPVVSENVDVDGKKKKIKRKSSHRRRFGVSR